MMTLLNLEPLNSTLQVLVGLPIEQVEILKHQGLALHFGSLTQNPEDGEWVGTWELHIKNCVWRLETPDAILLGSHDNDEKIRSIGAMLTGRKVEQVEVVAPSLDLQMMIDDQLWLRVFTIRAQKHLHWWFFTDDDRLLEIGPGNQWHFEDQS